MADFRRSIDMETVGGRGERERLCRGEKGNSGKLRDALCRRCLTGPRGSSTKLHPTGSSEQHIKDTIPFMMEHTGPTISLVQSKFGRGEEPAGRLWLAILRRDFSGSFFSCSGGCQKTPVRPKVYEECKIDVHDLSDS
mmetsp:Transcript_9084/g.17809  ORF Transcript_9084/g.17809 Transcript_9084/m.17809 type:complete len:138 (+) Transcript_9084:3105-3518(+)